MAADAGADAMSTHQPWAELAPAGTGDRFSDAPVIADAAAPEMVSISELTTDFVLGRTHLVMLRPMVRMQNARSWPKNSSPTLSPAGSVLRSLTLAALAPAKSPACLT
ncbi:MAG: hypothetical protein MO852_08520 [Candidatus Devosia euplotis]|nr:hypothetical protein [Candidatus Devosia euplotis]